MASDASLRLCRLLLRQSDRHPVRKLDGRDLAGFTANDLRPFLQRGLLVRRQNLGDADGLVFHAVNRELVASEIPGDFDWRREDSRTVEIYETDFPELCRQIRRGSELSGPPVLQIGPKSHFLGARGKGARRKEYYMARAVRLDHALDTLLAVRAHAPPETAVTIITPTDRDFPHDVLKRLEAERINLLVASKMLRTDARDLFALDLPPTVATGTAEADQSRLVMDADGHSASFDDVELSLPRREFAVLLLLANEAADVGGFVARERISDIIRSVTEREETFEEQVDRVIGRLRDVFRKDTRITATDRGDLIKTKSKVGYRLALPPEAVRVF